MASKAVTSCLRGWRDVSQVIAANYAYALDAGLFLIRRIDEDQADDILEAFYKFMIGDSGYTPAEAQHRLSKICSVLRIDPRTGSRLNHIHRKLTVRFRLSGAPWNAFV